MKSNVIMFCLFVLLSACNTISKSRENRITAAAATPTFFHDFDFEYSESNGNPFWLYSRRGTACASQFQHSTTEEDRTSGTRSLKVS